MIVFPYRPDRGPHRETDYANRIAVLTGPQTAAFLARHATLRPPGVAELWTLAGRPGWRARLGYHALLGTFPPPEAPG